MPLPVSNQYKFNSCTRGNWEVVRNYRRPWAEPPLITTRSGPCYRQFPISLMIENIPRPQSPLPKSKRPPINCVSSSMNCVSSSSFEYEKSEVAVQTEEVQVIHRIPENLMDFETEEVPLAETLVPALNALSQGGASEPEAKNTATAIKNIYEELRRISKIFSTKFGESSNDRPENVKIEAQAEKKSSTVGTSTSCGRIHLRNTKEKSPTLKPLMSKLNSKQMNFRSRENSMSQLKPLIPLPSRQSRISPAGSNSNSKVRSQEYSKRSLSIRNSAPSQSRAKQLQQQTMKSKTKSDMANWPPYKSKHLAMFQFPKVDRLLDEARKILGIPENKEFGSSNTEDEAHTTNDAISIGNSNKCEFPSLLASKSNSSFKFDSSVIPIVEFRVLYEPPSPRKAQPYSTQQWYREINALESKGLKRSDVSTTEEAPQSLDDQNENTDDKLEGATFLNTTLENQLNLSTNLSELQTLFPKKFECDGVETQNAVGMTEMVLKEKNSSIEVMNRDFSGNNNGRRKSRSVTKAKVGQLQPTMVKSLENMKRDTWSTSTGKTGLEVVGNLQDINRKYVRMTLEAKSLSTTCILGGATGRSMPTVDLNTEISALQLGDGYLDLEVIQNSLFNYLYESGSEEDLEPPTPV